MEYHFNNYEALPLDFLNYVEKLVFEYFPPTKGIHFKESYIFLKWIKKKREELDEVFFSQYSEYGQIKEEEKTKTLKKIQWKGKQKELAELFIQLQRKGWIENIEPKSIKELFTESNSIGQILKPIHDENTYEPTYSEVFTKNYKEQFNFIKDNLNNSI